MFGLTPENLLALNAAAARGGEEAILRAVAEVYADLDDQIALQSPRCDASGNCCRFEAFGHRLYLTTAEMLYFLASPRGEPVDPWDGTGCPWQVAGRCTARAGRPLGCRIYYCDGSDPWQSEWTERLLARLRTIHEQHDVPYLYAEWREMLSAASVTPVADKTSPGRRGMALKVLR